MPRELTLLTDSNQARGLRSAVLFLWKGMKNDSTWDLGFTRGATLRYRKSSSGDLFYFL